jgi:hypothetical protein
MQQLTSTQPSQHKFHLQSKLVTQPVKQEESTPIERAFTGFMPWTMLQSGAGLLQAKLEIGAVNDPLEHEADAMADRVMRMPMSGAYFEGVSGSTSIQRKCAACEDEKVQRKASGNSGGGVATAQLSNQIQSTRGAGQSIDGPTRGFMELGFGRDFSHVKIHTGDYAHQMNRDLGAKAFTVANDVYFARGEFQPSTEGGKRLLAHELAHTVQQGTGIAMKIQRACTPAEIITQNLAMHAFCDQPRACNMQTDTCTSATAKIAAGNGCISLRTNIQKNCFKPGDVGYQTHMQQLSESYAALRNCETVATAKCQTPPPLPKKASERILDFAKDVIKNGSNATKSAEEFLTKNPDLVKTVLVLGVIGIIALLADDATGVGFADDVLILPLAALVKVSFRFAFK